MRPSWFTGPQMISDVEAMLDTDFSNSRQTTADDVARIPLYLRFVGQAAKLLSPML